MPEATWIYQPGFPMENGSAFMINERLFSPPPLLCTGGSSMLLCIWAGTRSHEGVPKGMLADW